MTDLLAAVLLIGAVGIVLMWRRPPSDLRVRWDNPEPLNTDARRAASARRGIIAFVPLYTPLAGSSATGLSAEDRRAAAARLDYISLDPEHSNLAPTIAGIAAHRDRLEHCWLVSTPTVSMMSETALPLNLVYNSDRERCPCHTKPSFSPVAMVNMRPM